jgi:phosphohistidine phosphatase
MAMNTSGPGDHIRTLAILRHAKAERPSGVADMDRPLTHRGQKDATAAGEWLAARGFVPDLVLCSPAKRTRQTWHAVAAGLALADAPVVRYEPAVYGAGARELLELIARTDPDVGSVLLIGHNPVASTLSALLDPEATRDSDGLRTSGVALHSVPVPWTSLPSARAPVSAYR